jgi:hypothetical protein
MTVYFRADCSRGAREQDARPGRHLPEREIRIAGVSDDVAGRRV